MKVKQIYMGSVEGAGLTAGWGPRASSRAAGAMTETDGCKPCGRASETAAGNSCRSMGIVDDRKNSGGESSGTVVDWKPACLTWVGFTAENVTTPSSKT